MSARFFGVACLTLAACSEPSVPQREIDTAPEAVQGTPAPQALAPTPVATPEAPAQSLPETEDLSVPPPQSRDFPDRYVISTNEPFYQAIIGRATITLRGVDQQERTLTIDRRRTGRDGRFWYASDASGSVAARIVNRPCSDDMSAARFPFSGTITLDTAPIRGCARPEAVLPQLPDGS